MVRLGFSRLESSTGILRDGLSLEKKAPIWTLPDTTDVLHSVPNGNRWQFLIFTDHSLASFPELLLGIDHFSNAIQEVEMLVLARSRKEDCEVIAHEMNLPVPIVPVDQAFYDRYRVRIMPFATLLDPSGTTRWVGLVNTERQMFLTWEMARVRATYKELIAAKEVG